MAEPKGSTKLYLWSGIALVIAAAVVIYVTHGRASAVATERSELQSETARGPRVETAVATMSPAARNIRLLGDARAYSSVTLFAKVSGYVKSVSVDKGDQVKTGQVLAEIDSAETDAQYQAALADLENKKKLADRDADLLKRGNVSLQQAQTSETAVRMADQAVRNLATMKGYETIRAPFDGTITARFADPGALLQSATTSQSAALPVLTISDNSKLRIGVYVEQRDVPYVHVGDIADVSDASDAARRVTAKISRTAGALDPKTRTLYIEIDVDNGNNFLVPGAFAYVTLHLPMQSYPQLPVSALIMRGGKSYVAVVTDEGKVKLRSITVAATDGSDFTAANGVKEGDRVTINLPNEIGDGDPVQLVKSN
ncbi:MAG TPA: efflux RND transporter periplasmic adaptor subunit [Stellaceae bacterium]|nr:efflux RND transporter periplasmic adaptor subunit [Stellaceae bacterium]